MQCPQEMSPARIIRLGADPSPFKASDEPVAWLTSQLQRTLLICACAPIPQKLKGISVCCCKMPSFGVIYVAEFDN